ncbi:MAG: threonylcarbamoyl-AMP synthase [Alphaproteobacteria bacterium]|nr:threonylcarbamoyl-AMP synthase [Alphaproteobacteria bacterium]
MTAASQPIMLAPDHEGIARAAGLLRAGKLAAVPTETVYGLAARADSAPAVAAIYRAKGRPDFNPLIVLAAAERLAEFDERARLLAGRFWPGALTLVLPLRADAGLASAVTAGLPTVALRCPAHPVMRRVLEASGLPLAAPSANRSGAVSPTRPEHVAASLGGAVDAVVDGGACELGLESTIVALRPSGGWALLRPGPVSAAEIAALLGLQEQAGPGAARVEAPGRLASHYSPGKPVRLDAETAQAHEFHIGFGPIEGDANLSPRGDLAEAAARLYAALHEAAASPKPSVAVAPIPQQGLGEAIRDRLTRSAA